MRRLLIWLSSILLLVVAADIGVGIFSRWYMKHKSVPGDYRSIDYMLKQADDDVLVLGGSMALNSLNAKMMTDSLGVNVYNGASNGQYLPFYLTMLKSMMEHHKPKTVIVGLRKDELEVEGYGKRYNMLAPYYGLGYDEIDNGLDDMAGGNKWMLASNLYRMNTIWFRLLLYNFIEPGEKGERGFIGKPHPSMYPEKKEMHESMECYPDKEENIKELIELCKANDIDLIMYFPPVFYHQGADTKSMAYIRQACHESGITLYDDISLPPFDTDSTLYYDNDHLNVDGASKYTSIFIDRLRKPTETKTFSPEP